MIMLMIVTTTMSSINPTPDVDRGISRRPSRRLEAERTRIAAISKKPGPVGKGESAIHPRRAREEAGTEDGERRTEHGVERTDPSALVWGRAEEALPIRLVRWQEL